MKIRPSSLPALKECPAFVPDQSTGESDKSAGTERHKALGLYIIESPSWSANLDQIESDGVEWAGEYIRTHAPMSDHQIELEQKRSFLGPDFDTVTGTPDVVCGPVIFDLKWRDHVSDYTPQLAAYRLAIGRPDEVVEIHILYALHKRAEVHRWSYNEAEAIVFPIIESTHNPQPKACDYCGWCAKRMTCSAVVGEVAKIDSAQPVEQVMDADALGEMLRRARVVKEWCESVERTAKDSAFVRGVVPTGFVPVTQRGRRQINDLAAAFASAGLPQSDFLSACSVQFGDLVEQYATFAGLKKAQAERDLENKLGDTVTRGAEVRMLKTAKG